jgi:4-carboxymuconolactone decarboxylase
VLAQRVSSDLANHRPNRFADATSAWLSLPAKSSGAAGHWARRPYHVNPSAPLPHLGAARSQEFVRGTLPIPLLESPEISAAFADWQLAEGRYTTLSDRERQVVILAVGAIWRAPYELYSHSAAARTAGLSPEQVDTLTAGGMPDQLSTREQCAWRFARQITAERLIEQSLYDQAVELFEAHGIVDMLHLIGAYQFVCALLNTFDIPAPKET